MNECRRIYGQREDLALMGTQEAALNNADALVVVTEWQQFHSPDLDVIKASLSNSVNFDGRNLYNPEAMKKDGFDYYSIGRC